MPRLPSLYQGGGGNNFLDIQANFRFEQKGQQPTNSKGINMLENPMHSPHLFQSVGRLPDLEVRVSGSRPGDAILVESSQMGKGSILKDHEDFTFHS